MEYDVAILIVAINRIDLNILIGFDSRKINHAGAEENQVNTHIFLIDLILCSTLSRLFTRNAEKINL